MYAFSIDKGFSLIELMIASLMLMTDVLAAAGGMTSSIIEAKNSQDITKMTSALRQKMEELKATSYDSIQSGSDYLDSDGIPQSSSDGAAFSRTWTVTADSPGIGLKEITVSSTDIITIGATQPITLSTRTYRAP
jgi:Tfp pilus assembly protein PilV